MEPEIENWLREKGREKGTTTGRDRDCGWLDLVQLRYAARLNGVTDIVVTKLDVLSGIPYLYHGWRYGLGDRVPTDWSDDPGIALVPSETWQEDIRYCRHRGDLPKAAQDYLRKIENELAAPIDHISIGPQRDQYIR